MSGLQKPTRNGPLYRKYGEIIKSFLQYDFTKYIKRVDVINKSVSFLFMSLVYIIIKYFQYI